MRTTRIALSLALLLALAGGTWVLQAGPGADPFPHAPHMEEEMECATCHATDSITGAMVLNKESCAECHDDDTPAWTSRPARRGNLNFSHADHEDLECADCHKKTVTDKQDKDELLVGLKACTACHTENDVAVAPTDCARCHGKSAQGIVPTDHRSNWTIRHGKEARWRVFNRHGQSCTQCHRTDACQTCHRTTRPQDHTGLWRMRTHGQAAAFDRGRCKTCHETGECIQCHATTPPLNHSGAWLNAHSFAAQSTDNGKCAVCHRDVKPCAQCHGQ